MRVELQEVTHSFGGEIVLSKLTLVIQPGESWAITGSNGSGKTTVLRCLSGLIRPRKGRVVWLGSDEEPIHSGKWSSLWSYAAPYMELPEELSMAEVLHLQEDQRGFLDGLSRQQLIDRSGLGHAVNRAIKGFSSGMKQRLRLLLAYCTDSKIIFLDEPTSNLDRAAVEWLHAIDKDFRNGRSLIVGSNNVESEVALCEDVFDLSEADRL
ncbi:MAG: ABC transporter ATP-binding protein NatA [Flavobacteriia bacterium]|nr:MAG: ABC transporter ATP-binding protein NatA [Flavobacteriia bacterium]